VIRTGTLESAQANRRHLRLANGTGYWRSDLIADSADGGDHRRQAGPWMPQAFLVEQDPDSVILPHFHEENEFQVFIEGDGAIGRQALRPVAVHYAGRHTGYGPITSGSRGLWYFSLRAIADPGARFLPEARDRMEKGPKRHLFGETIEPQPDGIAAWISSRNDFPAKDEAARFYVVLAGEISHAGSTLPRLSVIFADEAFAYQGDASVLCTQFPC
jgi:hypothetical protein